jgi:hypothetical protein
MHHQCILKDSWTLVVGQFQKVVLHPFVLGIDPAELSTQKVAASSVQAASLQVDNTRARAFHELPHWSQYEMLTNIEQPVPGIRVGSDPKDRGDARQLRQASVVNLQF